MIAITSDDIQPRIHAFRDLKAYVCTLGGAECDAELFEDRDTWFEHELRKHRCEYICTLCSCGPFSFERLAAHIQNTHGHFSDRQLKMLREGGRQNSIRFKAEDCPFCDKWTEALSTTTSLISKTVDPTQDIFVTHTQFKKHVAIHQEQLAILALQRATGSREISGSKFDNTATPVIITKSPLKMGEDPVDKIIDQVDGISLSNANNPSADKPSNTISAAANADGKAVVKQQTPIVVSKNDGKFKFTYFEIKRQQISELTFLLENPQGVPKDAKNRRQNRRRIPRENQRQQHPELAFLPETSQGMPENVQYRRLNKPNEKWLITWQCVRIP